MDCSTPGLPVHQQLPEFTQTPVHLVGDAISHLILCRPLLLLPPIFPNSSTLLTTYCMPGPIVTGEISLLPYSGVHTILILVL